MNKDNQNNGVEVSNPPEIQQQVSKRMKQSIKKDKFLPGTKVIACLDYDNDEWDCEPKLVKYRHTTHLEDLNGIILDKSSSDPNKVYVQWSNTFFANEAFEEKREQEVLKSVLTLASKQQSLEKDFKVIAKNIKGKMKSLAKELKNINSYAKKNGFENLYEVDDIPHILESAMDNCGWNTSSLGC